MNTLVITHNFVEGYHCWPDAPNEVYFLRSEHRHVFDVRCWWKVNHHDREIEIILQQQKICDYLSKFGTPAKFGSMSCESIAAEIMNHFGNDLVKCQVLEDGYGGASLSR